MKTRAIILSGLLCAAGTLAGQYAIERYSLSGGGGLSTGGGYSLSGSVGASRGGRMTGGVYALEGGIYGAFTAVQTPGAPLLSVALLTNNTLRLQWPAAAGGFVLEQAAGLENAAWAAVSNAPVQVGAVWEVMLAPSAGQHFYRLRHP